MCPSSLGSIYYVNTTRDLPKDRPKQRRNGNEECGTVPAESHPCGASRLAPESFRSSLRPGALRCAAARRSRTNLEATRRLPCNSFLMRQPVPRPRTATRPRPRPRPRLTALVSSSKSAVPADQCAERCAGLPMGGGVQGGVPETRPF